MYAHWEIKMVLFMLLSLFKMKANKVLKSDAVFSVHLIRNGRNADINLEKILSAENSTESNSGPVLVLCC